VKLQWRSGKRDVSPSSGTRSWLDLAGSRQASFTMQIYETRHREYRQDPVVVVVVVVVVATPHSGESSIPGRV
jgi:hypothetical protein